MCNLKYASMSVDLPQLNNIPLAFMMYAKVINDNNTEE